MLQDFVPVYVAEGSFASLPRCPHCTAAPTEIEAARAWLQEHPGEEESWAAGRLASVIDTLRHWTAAPAEGLSVASRWRVCDGTTAVVDGLSQAQAESIVQLHNRQVTAARGSARRS